MQNLITLTGMVIAAQPVGEYDRRVVLLTKERGKITAFAKGARRSANKLLARTNLFCFGVFQLYEGRNSYTMVDAEIKNYFDGFREDYEAAMVGMYFLDVVNYYTRENNDEKEVLLLLYQSMRALLNNKLQNELVLYIFEIKTLVVNGEFPGIVNADELLPDTIYTIDFIVKSTLDKLYSFVVSKQVMNELNDLARIYRNKYIGKKFKSLEVLKNCGLKI